MERVAFELWRKTHYVHLTVLMAWTVHFFINTPAVGQRSDSYKDEGRGFHKRVHLE